jgi:hypothetical protein
MKYFGIILFLFIYSGIILYFVKKDFSDFSLKFKIWFAILGLPIVILFSLIATLFFEEIEDINRITGSGFGIYFSVIFLIGCNFFFLFRSRKVPLLVQDSMSKTKTFLKSIKYFSLILVFFVILIQMFTILVNNSRT